MSYAPTIIISKADLQYRSGLIEAGAWAKLSRKPSEKARRRNTAFSVLENALSHEGVKICGIVIVIIHPEGTVHNRDVRELLHELQIEFSVYE